jgi:hypothetical protein
VAADAWGDVGVRVVAGVRAGEARMLTQWRLVVWRVRDRYDPTFLMLVFTLWALGMV